MKKISILLGALAVVGFASCSDDTTPALNVPASFVLNTPPTAADYYELAPGATIDLSCSQPEYGFVAATKYSVEMALSENPSEADIYSLESNSPSQAAFTINQADVAMGICQLLGITNQDEWAEANLGYIPVYLRAVAQLNTDGLGLVKSNWIKLDNVKPYLAIPTPGFIYVVGSFTDWSQELNDKMREARIYENDAAIGSKIYSGVFNVPAGTVTFRFYTELGNWDANSYGPANNHGGEAIDDGAGANNIQCAFTDGEFSDGLQATKNSFQFPDWQGGEMTIVVDMSDSANPNVTISAGANMPVVTYYAYMVGNQAGWATPEAPNYDNWKLVDEGATGVYTG
ncbi:MAG: SusE domain-containing protein, partial [Muribaculaceae bacterium]|nr:SusE domain-containing protein [Muribaculaceae bacterium]